MGKNSRPLPFVPRRVNCVNVSISASQLLGGIVGVFVMLCDLCVCIDLIKTNLTHLESYVIRSLLKPVYIYVNLDVILFP